MQKKTIAILAASALVLGGTLSLITVGAQATNLPKDVISTELSGAPSEKIMSGKFSGKIDGMPKEVLDYLGCNSDKGECDKILIEDLGEVSDLSEVTSNDLSSLIDGAKDSETLKKEIKSTGSRIVSQSNSSFKMEQKPDGSWELTDSGKK